MVAKLIKIASLLSILLLSNCCSNPKWMKTTGDNSQNSLDWVGTYTGILSCVDCQGSQTVLKINKDLTYSLISQRKGKSDNATEWKGHFKWNDKGSAITLANNDQNGQPLKFQIGENRVMQLDAKGNKISGDSTDLTKMNDSITNKYWRLVELNGKAINKNMPNYFLKIYSENNRFNAKAGCNSMGGEYTITNRLGIKFSKIMSTKMACANMADETVLSDILEKVDNFSLNGSQLALNKAKMASLARFELSYFD